MITKKLGRDDNKEKYGVKSNRIFKIARRRSFSGSSIPSKTSNTKTILALKSHTKHINRQSNECSTTKQDEPADIDNSGESSTSNSPNVTVTSGTRSSFYKKLYHSSLNTKSRLKHFLSEYLSKNNADSHEAASVSCDLEEGQSRLLNGASNSLPRPTCSITDSEDDMHPLTQHTVSGTTYNTIAASLLQKFRNIQLQQQAANHSSPMKSAPFQLVPSDEPIQIDFPQPEPNPLKLPKVDYDATIKFSNKSLLNHKFTKRNRLSHSVSFDPNFRLADFTKHIKSKLPANVHPEFCAERDKWERHISGYLQTSTATGAALTAINFGLKRVTETDKFLMISKAPASNPQNFLEEGIIHCEPNRGLFHSYMEHITCYDLIPDRGKMVVVDSKITIRRTVDALDDNFVRGAAVWSEKKQKIIHFFSIYDIVPLLLHIHQLQLGNDRCTSSKENECEVENTSNEIPESRPNPYAKMHECYLKKIENKDVIPESNSQNNPSSISQPKDIPGSQSNPQDMQVFKSNNTDTLSSQPNPQDIEEESKTISQTIPDSNIKPQKSSELKSKQNETSSSENITKTKAIDTDSWEEKAKEFGKVPIEKCLKLIPKLNYMGRNCGGMLEIDPEYKLSTAVKLLEEQQQATGCQKTGLIITDIERSGNPLFILNDVRILSYVEQKMRENEKPCDWWEWEMPEQIVAELPRGLGCEEICQVPDCRYQYTIPKETSTLVDITRAMAKSYLCVALIVDANNSLHDVITISDILFLIKLNRHRNPVLTYTAIAKLIRPIRREFPFRDPILKVIQGQESINQVVKKAVQLQAYYIIILGETPGSLHGVMTPLDLLLIMMQLDQAPNVSRILPTTMQTISEHDDLNINLQDDTQSKNNRFTVTKCVEESSNIASLIK